MDGEVGAAGRGEPKVIVAELGAGRCVGSPLAWH